MNKLLITIFFAIFSTGTMAEWQRIGQNDMLTLTYVDVASISKNGNIARVWELYDFKYTQNKSFGSFLSSTQYVEYNCKNKTGSLLSINHYSENMMKGRSIKSYKYDDKKYLYILPNSTGEAGWKLACGKK